VLVEQRRFPPDPALVAAARIDADELARLREHAARDPEGYWADFARSHLTWQQPCPSMLRAIACGEPIRQDISTLENPAIIDQLRG